MIRNTIVLTEAGKSIGMGHFVRMSAICEGLIDKGFDVCMWLNSDDIVKPMTIREYVKHCNWLDDEKICDSINSNDVVIVDSYKTDLSKLEIIKSKCRKLIVIDDNIRLDYHDMTIVNPNIFGMFLKYPEGRNNDIHTGSGCTLLRKDFNKEKEKRINKDVSNILITMGGTDVKNITTAVIKYIRDFDNDAVLHVVVTDAYDETDKIKNAMGNNDVLYKNIDAEKMSSLMRIVDFTVASAGGTTNELLKMLCPAVLIGVADNQMLNIKYLSDSGYIRRFYQDDMEPISEMFTYECRRDLYDVMKDRHSNSTGVDVIAEIIKE